MTALRAFSRWSTHAAARLPLNMPLQRTINSLIQLTLVGFWRHNMLAGSDPVSAVAGR